MTCETNRLLIRREVEREAVLWGYLSSEAELFVDDFLSCSFPSSRVLMIFTCSCYLSFACIELCYTGTCTGVGVGMKRLWWGITVCFNNTGMYYFISQIICFKGKMTEPPKDLVWLKEESSLILRTEIPHTKNPLSIIVHSWKLLNG